MQKILWILLLYLISLPAYSTVCTDYLAGNYNPSAVITSQKEYIDKYEEMIGSNFISSIVYGKGYLKVPGSRKVKVSYLCQFADYKTPVWGYVFRR